MERATRLANDNKAIRKDMRGKFSIIMEELDKKYPNFNRITDKLQNIMVDSKLIIRNKDSMMKSKIGKVI